jgi:hypothetical protein
VTRIAAVAGWLLVALLWWLARFDDESGYARGYRYGFDRGRRRGYNDAMEGSAGA